MKRSTILVVIGLVLLIGAVAIAVIATSFRLVDGVDDTRQNVKRYHVKAENPFESSSVPAFFDYRDLTDGTSGKLPQCEKLLKMGNYYLSRREYDKSLKAFTAAIDTYKSIDDSKKGTNDRYLLGSCHRGLSEIYLDLGRYENAIEEVTVAYQLRRRPGDLHFRSRIYTKLGRTKLAAADEKLSHELVDTQNNLLEGLTQTAGRR